MKVDTIVIQKEKDLWEIARGADTNVTGELKVSAKVTIEYGMNSATIEGEEAGKKEAKKKGR